MRLVPIPLGKNPVHIEMLDSPCSSIVDISDVGIHVPLGNTPVQYSLQPTNGIVYFKALSNINSMGEVLKISVPLFCYIITK